MKKKIKKIWLFVAGIAVLFTWSLFSALAKGLSLLTKGSQIISDLSKKGIDSIIKKWD